MRKFLISSPNFKAPAEVVYSADGILIAMDITSCNLNLSLTEKFKEFLPASLDIMAQKFAKTNFTVVETEIRISFEKWWSNYNKKINRIRCEKIWEKMSNDMQVAAWFGIKPYDVFLQANEWRKKADPETYLRNQMWQNEWK